VATNGLYQSERDQRTFGPGVASDLVSPARDFIREHIPVDAQVFNTFDQGSRYLWWFYPERLPFIDGNGDGYPPEFFAEYLRITNAEEAFAPYARRYGIDWVYLSLKTKLARRLYMSAAWHPVYLDGDGIILVNQTPKFSELRKKFDLRADLARGHIPDWEPTPLPTFLHRTTPRGERVLAGFLFRVGEDQAAMVARAHARQFLPEGKGDRK
jgi:hypothetical protein